jgi:hypothetical protein
MVLLEPPGIDARLPAGLVLREAGIARHPMGRTQHQRAGVRAIAPAQKNATRNLKPTRDKTARIGSRQGPAAPACKPGEDAHFSRYADGSRVASALVLEAGGNTGCKQSFAHLLSDEIADTGGIKVPRQQLFRMRPRPSSLLVGTLAARRRLAAVRAN